MSSVSAMFDWGILIPVNPRSKYRDFEIILLNEQVEICRGRALAQALQGNTKMFFSLIAILYAPGLRTPGRVAEP